jgi:hypothetical protein
MLIARFRVEANSVSAVARLAVVIIVVCGLVGLAAGIERVMWADRLTEGIVIVVGATMATAVSITLLLFVAWRVELADRTPDGGPSQPSHHTKPEGADAASPSTAAT